MNLNEFRTRLEIIDKSLAKSGWNVDDPTHVRAEIDTKQSDFSNLKYQTVKETLRNDLESKYADYLLLDSKGAPLAIIEAKRMSKDPYITARKQAEEYAEDIKKQTGKDVFIFLSNGDTVYFYNYGDKQSPRAVMGFFSRDDLEKIRWINENKKPLVNVDLSKSGIVDREKSIENVKRVLQHINKNNRKGLIVMATGTGKTRVAMSIIDELKKHKWIKRVLFVADRRQLRNQAMSKGFKEFFPNESKDYIYSSQIDKSKNLFCATIQTLQECYEDFSPGFFDLIISDEAHRSIYNKWKDIFTYFDSIQIGLTATPREAFDSDDMKDTFRFFNCEDDTPTAMYDFDEAVEDGVLVSFKEQILSAQTKYQVEGLKSENLTQSQKDELVTKGVDVENIDFEGTKFEKKFVTKGTNEAIIREVMENAQTDQTGTLPAKTIIFAMTQNHAKRLQEAFEKLYPEEEYFGLTRVIVSSDSRSRELMDDFEKKSFPRIAISVDMLDTGIDVPEVCNLVFAKPVFSKIKFWQMLGRGTRSNSACNNEEWLPNGKKEFFKVFDFWNNFEFFKMKPEGVKSQTTEALTVQLFRSRVEQLKLLNLPRLKEYPKGAVDDVKSMILSDIHSIPKELAVLKDKRSHIEKAESPNFYSRKGIDPIEFLNTKISPLMRYKSTNYEEVSFMLKCEKLGLAILKGDEKLKERYSKMIAEVLEELPYSINEVAKKKDLIEKYSQVDFWESIKYENIREILSEITPLVKYRDKEKVEPIVVDLSDEIIQRKVIEFGPNGEQEYVKKYKERVESKIKELVTSHPTIKKIKNGERLTDKDIEDLENSLNSPGLYLTEEVLNKFYSGTFIQFIKEILGMYNKEAVEDEIEKSFQRYIVENNKQYNANQLQFIGVMKTVFKKQGHVELDMLFDPPFTNVGDPFEIGFDENEIKDWVKFCKNIEGSL